MQADPYAAPSRIRLEISAEGGGLEAEWRESKLRRSVVADVMLRKGVAATRSFGLDVGEGGNGWKGAKGGELVLPAPGQAVLERSTVSVDPQGGIEVRVGVNLPARGRSILGRKAADVLSRGIPALVGEMVGPALESDLVWGNIHAVEDQVWVRQALRQRGLVAFVADGSILPRVSGADDRPMAGPDVVPFEAPEELAVFFDLPGRGESVRGMGIKEGITMIAGGGYHGKSTLLSALQLGVYNHILGDGREMVVTDENAVKIRAEDGRAIASVDISSFIDNLPHGKSTTAFVSQDASGSTSQAANICEALELGASTLLVDEDTCATNFMIRDARMQALVAKANEPITPFIAKIRTLYTEFAVSTVLVIGGSGDFFDVADTVLLMANYVPSDVTARAKEIQGQLPSLTMSSLSAGETSFAPPTPRAPIARSLSAYAGGKNRVKVRETESIDYGDEHINLHMVEQLTEIGQTKAIADAMVHIQTARADGRTPLAEILAALDADFDAGSLDVINPERKYGWYSRPRKFEIAAAINRLRTVEFNPVQPFAGSLD